MNNLVNIADNTQVGQSLLLTMDDPRHAGVQVTINDWLFRMVQEHEIVGPVLAVLIQQVGNALERLKILETLFAKIRDHSTSATDIDFTKLGLVREEIGIFKEMRDALVGANVAVNPATLMNMLKMDDHACRSDVKYYSEAYEKLRVKIA